MQSHYESMEWGWKDGKKRLELTDSESRYIVARQKDNSICGFLMFRIEQDDDPERDTLYVYELQLDKTVQRCGLGKHLMQTAELLARKSKLNG
jgi:ribosomal protein S18 acetylase RimI-like enzyme